MSDRKLWQLTDKDCKMVDYDTAKGAVLISSPNVPAIFWPDGTVCWPVTMWLTERSMVYVRNKSRKGRRNRRGGTSVTVASLISHLIRYVYQTRKKSFELLDDDDIKYWVSMLRSEMDDQEWHKKKRGLRQVGKIIRTALNFLRWYQKTLMPNDGLIGEGDSYQISISMKEGSKTARSGKSFGFEYITHRHIPYPDTPRDVKPIGHASITILYDALRETASNPSIRRRDENILRLLEATGGRRVEVIEITVDDLLEAHKKEELRLYGAKTNDEYRVVPISREWLQPIVLYAKTHRDGLVKKLIRDGKITEDPGFLFLNSTNGKPLSEEWVTKLISKLRLAAGISEKLCPHMFRHRFITIQVATRIRSYSDAELPTDIAHTILTKVATLTGHKDPKSLSHYIDLAFDELGLWEASDKVLAMRHRLEGAYRQIQTLRSEIRDTNVSKRVLLDKVDFILGDLMASVSEAAVN